MNGIKVGYALTGSFCTFEKSLAQMQFLKSENAEIIPIMSYNAYSLDTRFGKAEYFRRKIEEICGRDIISTITAAEPIGPQKLTDVLVVLPCTGNTLAKLANGIYDTPVTLAVKSHLRNQRPVVIGVSSNDSLSSTAKNIGALLNNKNYYFIPMRQDDPTKKPFSVVCDFSLVKETVEASLYGKQLQPMLLSSQ